MQIGLQLSSDLSKWLSIFNWKETVNPNNRTVNWYNEKDRKNHLRKQSTVEYTERCLMFPVTWDV